jgi:hypothetical protein
MPPADIKGNAGSGRQKKDLEKTELEKLQNTLDEQEFEISGYKKELASALERINELEGKILILEQKPSHDVKKPTAQDLVMEGEATLIDIKITPVDFSRPSVAIPQDRPFKLCLSVNLPRPKSVVDLSLPWRLSVYAKNMAGGTRWILGETIARTGDTEKIQTCMMGNAPKTGTYRIEIEAVLTPPGDQQPFVTHLEDGLINVY